LLQRDIVLEEFIEDGTILHQRGAERLSARFASEGPHRDGVRRTIVLHHAGVKDGSIRGALIKAALGIAFGLEERSDELVSFSDRGLGVIEEAGLQGLPLGGESLPFGIVEFVSLQCVHAVFTISQICLGRFQRALHLDGAIVLGTEAIAEGRRPGFAALKIIANDDYNNNEYNYSDEELGTRELMKHCVLLCGISSTAKNEWESLCRQGGTYAESMMGGHTCEYWSQLHTVDLRGV
jgi:hypothetical protein